MPKFVTNEAGITGRPVTLTKTVEVIATEKSNHKTGSKRLVSEIQAVNLLKRGMVEDYTKTKKEK